MHAARAEEVTGAFGRTGRVAEGHRQRRRAGRTLGQATELEQPQIGVGRLREPLQDHRQQLLHQAGAPGQAVGQLAHRGPGAFDVGEAERGEAFLGGLRGERTGAGERLEERGEEEPLVDAADGTLVLAVLGGEPFECGALRAVAVTEHARQTGARHDLGRDGVGLLLVVELDPVLDVAQEAVRAVEPCHVGAIDVAAVGELVQRVECGR